MLLIFKAFGPYIHPSRRKATERCLKLPICHCFLRYIRHLGFSTAMSLDDKFYPEDGSALTRADNFLIKSAGKMGEAYQHATGRSYKDLVTSCYKISGYGFALGALGLRVSSLLFWSISSREQHHPKYQSPLEEEIEKEALGRWKSSGKCIRALQLGACAMLLCLEKPVLDEGIDTHSRLLIYAGLGSLLEGAAFLPYNFAEYLSKADVPQPPKKTIWERAKDKLSMWLAPEPVPVLDSYSVALK